tara:strand:- start:1242 stop:2702 length:1461 start_codon:yes stop_codon:yes gene_type:complete
MLASIRKFSSSIYAKIFLIIVAIPFVFWGMGPLFTGGNVNIVVVIDKEKHSTQDFVDYMQKFISAGQKINIEQIEEFLSLFISEKLIEKEIDHFAIKLSDDSLSKLIKHQKDFERDDKFSRVEYEKFLLKNNITAVFFENNLSRSEKKKQLLEFIGGGVLPPEFLVNNSYNKINQKRSIQFINLNDFFKNKFNFSENQIITYYKNNKENFKEIYKSIKIIELNPKTVSGSDEFNDTFFKKIDEIDDLIFQGEKLEYITQQFNLGKTVTFTVNKSGHDINLKKVEDLPKDLIKKIFNISDTEPTVLVEEKDKYFIVEVSKTEKIERKLADKAVREIILQKLETQTKRKLLAEIISKINQNNFIKSDFDKLSKDENLPIKKARLNSQNDDKIFKQEVLNQIYSFPEKKIIVFHDMNLEKNFLIFIDKIEHVAIDDKSTKYEKYLNLSNAKITNGLFNTYDSLIKKRYKIDINYKALDTVKNYYKENYN